MAGAIEQAGLSAPTMGPAPFNREVEQRVAIPNVDWALYESLLSKLAESQIRLTYSGGTLEIMSPSPSHERWSRLFFRVVDIASEEFGIEIVALGSTTFRREQLAKGLEPDECFYVANAAKILGKREIDLRVDPPPDLAIEIDVSVSQINRTEIYQALGVPEIWQFDGSELRIFRMDDRREYQRVDRSPIFPTLAPEELTDWVIRAWSMGDQLWKRQFRTWVRQQGQAGATNS
jgi:Uma2 family endonuclease